MSKFSFKPLAILQAVFFVQIDTREKWDDQENKRIA